MDYQQKQQLDQSFSRGGEQELEQAVALYGDQLFHHCFSMLCDYHDAQDAVQTAFIKAYRNRRRFRGDSSLSTWLIQIAHRAAIDIIRKRKPVTLFSDSHSLEQGSPVHPPLQEDSALTHLDGPFSEETMRAMKTLTPEERALLYSRACEERSYAELSRIFRKSESALRQQYRRARHKLIAALGQTSEMKGGVVSCETNSTARI